MSAPANARLRYPWRRTVRSVFQAIVMFAPIAPLIYQAATNQSPEAATGAAGLGLLIMAAVTRIMAVPAVEAFLQRFVPWLAARPPESTPQQRTETGSIDLRLAVLVAVAPFMWVVDKVWPIKLPPAREPDEATYDRAGLPAT